MTPGVETTTGPLGQGFANAVGMALAEKLLAAEFNRPGLPLVDHHTYVLLGDGCLMEGISHEAASLAGVWKLGKLVAIYDDNGISIDGEVKHWFGDDTAQRFAAYGWNVLGPIDGHDVDAVDRALGSARHADKPTLIIARTVIGNGAPTRAGTEKAHGEPLGDAEIAATRAALGWMHAPFAIPEAVYAAWDARPAGAQREGDWRALLDEYRSQYPRDAAEFERRMHGDLPHDFEAVVARAIEAALAKGETVATRKASQLALEALTASVPELLGGSADLTGSNLTKTAATKPLRTDADFQFGRHINYGVREFGMSAIMNGIALHGGYIPFGATFLTFSDYSRNALRMAALMKQRVRLRVHPRLDRPRRRRPDPPVGRAGRQPAPDPQPGRLASVRHGRDRSPPGPSRSSAATGRRACSSRARACRSQGRRACARGDRARRLRAFATHPAARASCARC